jgi:Protein of unknown function (DUF2905)
MSEGFGKILIVAGLAIAVLGVLIYLGGKVPWLGNLPGDIRIQRDHFSFFFPLTTCILVSVVLSVVLWLLRR